MKRRELVRKAAVGSLVTAGAASAVTADDDDVGTDACYFECCEDCERYCPDGTCNCEYYCELEP